MSKTDKKHTKGKDQPKGAGEAHILPDESAIQVEKLALRRPRTMKLACASINVLNLFPRVTLFQGTLLAEQSTQDLGDYRACTTQYLGGKRYKTRTTQYLCEKKHHIRTTQYLCEKKHQIRTTQCLGDEWLTTCMTQSLDDRP